jgi:hypothetical protein
MMMVPYLFRICLIGEVFCILVLMVSILWNYWNSFYLEGVYLGGVDVRGVLSEISVTVCLERSSNNADYVSYMIW